ncbi:MAG: molybdopterin oxidoreductase family protein [Rhodobacteraceae bacterium]|nr:MAG: molybdopterin oxidoreductase family protein [Paracoccaceae bacterium]
MERRVRGCCPLDCQDSCAWIATVEDGRVTGVVGDPDHPITQGVLCAKVRDYETRTYAPDRLLHPLRRVGPKGAGQFERISWDEALGTIAARFASVIETHGAEAIMPMNYLGSMGVLQRRALMRLFHALGASAIHGEVCGAAGLPIIEAGHPFGFDPEEIADSELIVLWGANLLTTAHHHWRFVQEARERRGATVVVIDPRRTRTARKADVHLAIRPGTDVILAASLGRILLAEGLVDRAYAADVALDLDAYAAEVAPWTAERAAEVCGIEAADITALARRLGAARPAVIRPGVGPMQTISGDAFVRALSALAILGGHWRRRGGGLFFLSTPRLDEAAAERSDLAPGPRRSLDIARLGQLLTDPDLDPPVKALTVWGTNPALIQPDVDTVRRGLAREDLFTVVLEHFMTDTARYADIVLPSTTQFEHFDVQGAWGHHYILLNEPAVPPLGEAKAHAEVMRLLAARMGLTDPALRESDEEIAAAALPADAPLSALRETGWRKASPPRPDLLAEGARLPVSIGLEALREDLPDGTAPEKLRLLTPKAHYFLNSTFGNMPRHRAAQKRPTLQIHPADAEARALVDGSAARVGDDAAALVVVVEVTEDVRPGVVALEGKWWRTEGGPDAVANRLAPARWTPAGQPVYNDIFVDVAPAL